ATPSESEAAAPGGEGGASIGCDMPTETYAANMSQKGATGALTFVLVGVNGDAPAVAIDTWTIKLLDAGGKPVNGATFTVKAWMPEHAHGWTKATTMSEGSGAYEIDNLYLFMPGVWQVTLTAQSGSLTDSTVFSFCLGG
ncbi:MAG: FixH family protein, partial [Polyangiaceae bacterium]